MKFTFTIIIALATTLCLTPIESTAQTSGSESAITYEFALIKSHGSSFIVYYSSGEVEDGLLEKGEMREVVSMKKLEKLSSEGWEVVNHQTSLSAYHTYLLRREKK